VESARNTWQGPGPSPLSSRIHVNEALSHWSLKYQTTLPWPPPPAQKCPGRVQRGQLPRDLFPWGLCASLVSSGFSTSPGSRWPGLRVYDWSTWTSPPLRALPSPLNGGMDSTPSQLTRESKGLSPSATNSSGADVPFLRWRHVFFLTFPRANW
jgi:hypothetical protein